VECSRTSLATPLFIEVTVPSLDSERYVHTGKTAHDVTSIKQSPVLNGHPHLVLS